MASMDTAKVVRLEDLRALANEDSGRGNRFVHFLHPRMRNESGRPVPKSDYRTKTANASVKNWELISLADKNRMHSEIMANLKTQDGIEKIAKDLHSPVLSHLDYESIAYNLLDTELYKPAVPMIKHTDFHRGDWRDLDLPALIVDDEGETNTLRMVRSTLNLKPFDVGINIYAKYSDLSETMFDVLARLKDRVAIAMALALDLRYFSLLDTASTIYNTAQSTANPADRPFISRLAYQVERHRLPVVALVGGPGLTRSIRTWNVWEVGFDTLAEINSEGYLANIYGMNIWISNKITPSGSTATCYAVSSPKFHGFRGIRQTLMVQLTNDPRRWIVGISGYERYSLTVWNILSCCRGQFSLSADPAY